MTLEPVSAFGIFPGFLPSHILRSTQEAGQGSEDGYVTDVSDEKRAFPMPCLLLGCVDNPSHKYDLRGICNAVQDGVQMATSGF